MYILKPYLGYNKNILLCILHICIYIIHIVNPQINISIIKILIWIFKLVFEL
jgi:hypothetical protein